MKQFLYLLLLLCFVSYTAFAQQEMKEDSLSSPYLRPYQDPTFRLAPRSDSTLLVNETQSLGSPSPLVSFLLSGGRIPTDEPLGYASSVLALPLVSDYQFASMPQGLPPLKLSSWSITSQENLQQSWVSPKLSQTILFSSILLHQIRHHLQTTHLDYFTYGAMYLDSFRQDLSYAPLQQVGLRLTANPLEFGEKIRPSSTTDITEEISRKYWVWDFESSIQFSQNYLSENWYKGGSTNLNILTRNYLSLTYTKDKIQWKNELESKLSIYNADKDSVHRYRIADDLFRLRTNFGLRAIRKLYYTLDAEVRTQLFNIPRENSHKLLSASFSPLTANLGLGMKWDYTYISTEVYGRKFSISFNVAPLSYTYRIAPNTDIELKRYSLTKEKPYYHRIGSTIRANWQWDVNMNLSWSSRLYFNTSYENVEAEWENIVNMRLTRVFSTQLMLNLRYDDAVPPSKLWNRYLQYNEIISFGFSYRL